MPVIPENGLYRCPRCALVYVNPGVMACETWVDKIWGPWVEFPCAHCGCHGLQMLGKVKLTALTKDEMPTRKRELDNRARGEA